MGKRTAGLTGLSRWTSVFDKAPATAEPTEPEEAPRPTKKQKTTPVGSGLREPGKQLALQSQTGRYEDWSAYDASKLVQHYNNAQEVPEHLQKYYAQRNRFFSMYSTVPGCLLDEEGWYSVTPERIADRIAERCRCDTILDAFCGVGGNAIAFAKTCERVIALDTSPTRLALARHNAHIYGVAHRIEFILTDYLSFAESCLSKSSNDPTKRKIDVVFLSPPWGGPAYLSGTTPVTEEPTPPSAEEGVHPSYNLSSIQPIHGAELFALTRKITRNVAYFLPRNTVLTELAELVDAKEEKVEVEEEWMGSKLKALTCYYGGLAEGQAELW